MRISAGAAAWMPLMDASMGRYRGSHRGRLLHLSHGPGGAGYAQQTIVDRKAALEFVRSLLSEIGAPEAADQVPKKLGGRVTVELTDGVRRYRASEAAR